jgi:hypothetical protein
VYTLGRSKGTPKSVLIATRVTPRINEMIKQMANREGLYVSEWVRKIITIELSKHNMLGRPLYVPTREQESEEDNYSYPARRFV